MSANGAPAGATAAEARGDSGVSVLGRLLWVGVVAGLVVGGLVGALVSGEVDFFSIGAMVGSVAGVMIEAVNAAVLIAARRALRGLSRPLTRALLVPLPAAGALIVPSLISASYSAAGWFVVIGAGRCARGVAGRTVVLGPDDGRRAPKLPPLTPAQGAGTSVSAAECVAAPFARSCR